MNNIFCTFKRQIIIKDIFLHCFSNEEKMSLRDSKCGRKKNVAWSKVTPRFLTSLLEAKVILCKVIWPLEKLSPRSPGPTIITSHLQVLSIKEFWCHPRFTFMAQVSSLTSFFDIVRFEWHIQLGTAWKAMEMSCPEVLVSQFSSVCGLCYFLFFIFYFFKWRG